MEPAVSSSTEAEERKPLRFEGTLREFAESLRQPRVRLRQDATVGAGTSSDGLQPPPTEDATLQFDCVSITERSVPYPNDELRDFVAWLNRTSRSSAGFCFSIRELVFHADLEREEGRPAWANLLANVIGNLLSLGSVLSLRFSLFDRFSSKASREIGANILLPAMASSKTLKGLYVSGVDFESAGMSAALMALMLRLPLDTLDLSHCYNCSASNSAILRAALNPETARFRSLRLNAFIDASYVRPLAFNATNQTLQELWLDGSFTYDAWRSLTSALKHNRCLRSLALCISSTNWGFGDFGEMLAVNTSLESLLLMAPRFLDSDLELISIGLRQNRTLKRLHLYFFNTGTAIEMTYVGCGLQPLIELLRYHNTTLEEVSLPRYVGDYDSWHGNPILRALNFNKEFRSACQALRRGEVLERWLPLLGSTHPSYKATLLFCLARLHPETVAQSLPKWAVVEEDAVAAL